MHEAIIVIRVLSQAQSSQKPAVSDCQSARATIIAAVQLYHVPTANMGGVSYIMGVVLIFAMCNARRNGQKPPCVNSGYAPAYAVAVLQGHTIVGHVPRRIAAACSIFLRKGGTILCIITAAMMYFSRAITKLEIDKFDTRVRVRV